MNSRIITNMFIMLFLWIAGFTYNTYAQELIPFGPRFTQENVRGNLTITANDIVGIVRKDGVELDPNAAYNEAFTSNGSYVTALIDIDGDPNTFSSSSANLSVPNETCSRIVYAGLYWSANYYMSRTDTPDNSNDAEVTPNTDRNGRRTNTDVILTVNNGPFAQQYVARYSQFDNDNSDIRLRPVSSFLVVAQPVDGCNITNAAELAGNIAVIRAGGSCGLRNKVVRAQQAGAIGVVIVSNTNQNMPQLAGNGAVINIPSVSVGNSIRDAENDYNGDLITLLNNYNGVVLGTLSTTGGGQLFNLPATDPRKFGPADFRNIKFKTPAGGPYINITADNVVWDGYANTVTNTQVDDLDGDGDGNRTEPVANDEVQYVCYADVTNLIDPANPFGTYTVADMNATQGFTPGFDGACGGWVMVVIYENLLESNKYISVQDGYVQIFPPPDGQPNPIVDFDFNGFRTLQGTQPVDVKFGVATLEGDKRWIGDQLLIERTPQGSGLYTNLGSGFDNVNDINPVTNFFNSSITIDNNYIAPRNPQSINTMGFDADLFELPNAGNQLIGNNQTNANFRLETDEDRYSVFLGTFSVTVIEPELRIIKRVFDLDGTTEITNGNVRLGDELFYDLEIENVGNEEFADGTVRITDVLPANTDLLGVQSVPPGVTFTETTPGTIVFEIPSDLVETDKDGNGSKDNPIFIRFRAQIVASCEELRDACSDVIQNSATATYTGAVSGIDGDTTSSSEIDPTCQITGGEASNILVEVPPCSQDVTFCNDDLTLVAGTGYDRYTWTGPGIGTPVVQLTSNNPNANVFVVPNPQTGVYQVVKEDTDPADGTCMTLTELFDVEDFRDIENPILDYVNGDNVVTENCSGLEIPQILLCGDQTFDLVTTFSSANLVSISWQGLTPSGNCVLDPNDPCSSLSSDCVDANWAELPNGNTANFTVEDAGDYRILAEFDGGCVIPFFFSVFKNDYQPALSANPIECGNDGSVTVTNVPNNFGFSLNPTGPFNNTTGIFAVSTPGDVTVYAKDLSFPSGCTYDATINVPSFDPTFSATAVNPSCINDDSGTGTGGIQINITGGTPEYQYTISGPTLTNPIVISNSNANNGSFLQENLQPGTYDVEMISNRPAPECIDSQQVTISPATDIRGTAVLVAPPTCDNNALIQINVTPPGNYTYSNGNGNFQTSNRFEIDPTAPGPPYTFFINDEDVPDGTPDCIIEVPFNDPIPAYVPIEIDNPIVPIDPPCPGDLGRVPVQLTSADVAGREYTYELRFSSSATDTIFTDVAQIVSPLRNVTFVDVPDNDFYRVFVSHNNTTPPGTTPPTICEVASDPFSVDSPDGITFDVNLERPLSCVTGNENAIIRIENLAGGSGSYEWSFDNVTFLPITLPDEDIPVSAPADPYTIYVRDAGVGDCAVSRDITVPELLEIDDIIFTAGTDDCPARTSEVTFEAQPALTATEIANGVTMTYNVTPDPASGAAATGSTGFVATNSYTITQNVTYTVVARRSDSQCELSRDYRVDLQPQVDITSAVQVSPVSCNGGNDGSLSFTVDLSELTAYDYTIEDASTTTIATGTGITTATTTISSPGTVLVTGTYTITVTGTGSSGANCTDTATVTITEPDPITFTPEIIDQNCITSENTVGVSGVTGGNGPVYTFEILDSSGGTVLFGPTRTDQTITNVPNGTGYVIRVTDTDGCSNESAPFDIDALPGITLAIPSSDLCLDDGVATIDVAITGGTADFSYRIERDGTQIVGLTALPTGATSFTTPDLTQAGSYAIFVTDSNGCVESITQLIEPAVGIVATRIKDITCTAPTLAEIQLTITGGNGTNTITYVNNTTAATGTATAPTFNTSDAGEYIFTVTDSEGCTAVSLPILISDPVPPTITADPVTVLCFGDSNAVVSIEVVGPDPNGYTIEFDGAAAIPITGTEIQFSNLAARATAYPFTIIDSRGCTYPGTVDVNQPDEITAVVTDQDIACDATMGGNILGSITLTLSGGTPDGDAASYTYSVTRDGNPFAITPTFPSTNQALFSNLDFGFYEITVTDANGCQRRFSETINNVVDGIDITENISGTCPAGADIDITITGGSGVISGPPRTVPGFRIEIIGVAGTNRSLGDDGGSPANPVRTTNYTGIPFGQTYTVFVEDLATGCTYQEDITPTPPNSPTVTVTNTNDVSCVAGDDGNVSFEVTGYDPVAGQSLFWEILDRFDTTIVLDSGTAAAPLSDPEVITSNAVLEDGRYIVRVTEQAGTLCPGVSDEFIIGSPDPINSIIAAQTEANCIMMSATVTLSTTGGTPFAIPPTEDGYTYALVASGAGDPGTYPLSSNTIDIGSTDGQVQDIWVADANGCSFGPIPVTTVAIDDPQFINTPYVVNNPCDANNYTVNTEVIDGKLNASGNLFYGIDDGVNPINFVEDDRTHQFTLPTFGTFTLVVRDINGCEDREPVTIFPPLEITAAFDAVPDCRENDGTIIATISGGSDYTTNPGNFTFILRDNTSAVFTVGQTPGPGANQVTFGTNTTPNGIPPGDYTVEVIDANGGMADCNAITPVSITIPEDPTLTPSVNPVTCFGGNDGSINVTLDVTDIDGPYTYQLFEYDIATSTTGLQVGTDQTDDGLFDGLSAGDYQVVVTSASNCSSSIQPITIDQPAEVMADVRQGKQFDCSASPNATILIENVTGGSGTNYTANIIETGGAFTQNDIALVVTPPGITTVEVPVSGTYEVQIFDNSNCESIVYTVTIDPYVTLNNPTVVIDQDITCPTDEQITITVQDGSGNFLFELIDNSGTQITPPAPVTTTGSNTASFTLPRDLGVYTFRITDQGDGSGLGAGCSVTVSHEIDEFDFIEVTAAEETPVSCFGDADGTANITITGYTGTFNYEILDQDGNALTPAVTGTGNATSDPYTVVLTDPLAQGAYTINILETATPNCEEDSNAFTIGGPDREVLLEIIAINNQEFCDPDGNGAFQATATGTRGTVTYTAVGTAITGYNQTNATGLFDGLSADTYTVTVNDVVNTTVTCTATGTFTVNPPSDDVDLTANGNNISCFGEQDGSITATATGTDVPIQYTITQTNDANGAIASPVESARVDNGTFNNLAIGTYVINAYDNFGCTDTSAPIIITEPARPEVAIDASPLLNCGENTGTVEISGTADGAFGRTVTTFGVINPDGSESTQANGTFNLPAGEYLFFVLDNNGCRSLNSNPVVFEVIPDIVFELDLAQAVINCTDEATGSVDLLRVNGQTSLTGGFGTYNFRLVNTTTGDFWPGPTINDTRNAPYTVDGVQVPPSFFRELPPGDYEYYVSTDRNCTTPATFTIQNPPLFERVDPEVTNVLCFGEDNGQIVVFAQGGTPPYSFAISSREGVNFNDDSDGVDGQHTFTMLAPNDPAMPYQIQVQDANGCSQIYDVDITEPLEITAGIIGEVMPETCAGDMDGSVTVEIGGGTAPYEFNITNEDSDFVPVPDPTNLFIDNLPGGQTLVFIRDANNCRIELPVEVLPGVDINGALQPDRDCPIYDPITGVEIQPLTYYVDFDAFGADVLDDNIDIQYILEAVDPANPAPFQSLDDPRRYIVQPNIEYAGRMLHSRGCERDLGTITVDEYIPLTNLRAEMTGNASDPNEYELFVDGGADGDSDEYTYIVIRLDNVRLDDPDTVVQNAIDELTIEDFEDGLLEENIFFIRRTGRYFVRVIDNVGCEFTAVLPLTYINIRVPNYFTPGKDDPNTPDREDFWYPRQITPDQDPNDPTTFFFENMEVRVFDRYGRLLANFKGFDRGWDGIYKGEQLPSGDYWYTVILNDAENKEFTGHFTLYR